MKFKSNVSLAAAAALTLSSFAFAAPPMSGGAMSGAGTPEAAFVQKAAQGGMAEVELSKLAARNSSSSDVKSFANSMVEAHTANNAKLMQIAHSEGLDVPTTLDADHVAMKAKLASLKGAAFDRQYADAMRTDHTAMLALLDDNQKTLTDPKLKGYIGETRPAVAEHLKMAKALPAG